MESLADFLGLLDTGAKGEERPVKKRLSPKQLCQAILNSVEFEMYIVDGITEGNIPPQILLRIMDHGWGKVTDKLEIKDTASRLEGAPADLLEQRAALLIERARQIRSRKSEDSESTPGSIH